LAEDGFGAAEIAVVVSGVEQGDAQVQGFVDDLARGFEVDAPAEIVAAQTYQRDLQTGFAEISALHRCSLCRRRFFDFSILADSRMLCS